MNQRAVGARIKAVRESRRLTQEEFAELVELSSTHVSVIERGVKAPRLETFVTIANALEVSADVLLFDVVDHSMQSTVSELSIMIEKLPKAEQLRILNAVRMLLIDHTSEDERLIK